MRDDLLGKLVSVTWANYTLDEGESQEDKWSTFRVLGFDQALRCIKLQGISVRQNERYCGGPLWTPLEHLTTIFEEPGLVERTEA